MQNDTLKNRIVPWQEKGRWYHFTIDSNGVVNDKSDQFIIDHFVVELFGATAWRIVQKAADYTVKPYRVIQINTLESDDFTISAVATMNYSDYVFATGRIAKFLHSIPATGTVDCWAFIV